MFEFVFLAARQQELPPKPVPPPQQAVVRAWDGTSEGMSVGWLDPGRIDGGTEWHGDMPEKAPEKVPTETGGQVIMSGYTATRPVLSGYVHPYPVC